jgi:hypothetical protein
VTTYFLDDPRKKEEEAEGEGEGPVGVYVGIWLEEERRLREEDERMWRLWQIERAWFEDLMGEDDVEEVEEDVDCLDEEMETEEDSGTEYVEDTDMEEAEIGSDDEDYDGDESSNHGGDSSFES